MTDSFNDKFRELFQLQKEVSQLRAALRLERLTHIALRSEIPLLVSNRLPPSEVEARLEKYGLISAYTLRAIQLTRPELISLLSEYTSDGESESFLSLMARYNLLMILSCEERRQLASDGNRLAKYCQLREEAYELMMENI